MNTTPFGMLFVALCVALAILVTLYVGLFRETRRSEPQPRERWPKPDLDALAAHEAKRERELEAARRGR